MRRNAKRGRHRRLPDAALAGDHEQRVGEKGIHRSWTPRPDAAAGSGHRPSLSAAGRSGCWLLECDRDTERSQTLREKAKAYADIPPHSSLSQTQFTCDYGRAERPPRGAGSSITLLEHHPAMVEQLAFEAHLVGAHTRGERETEIGAGQPARYELKLQERLPDAARAGSLTPLGYGLDVVEKTV